MLKLCTMCDKKSPLTLSQNLTNSKRAYKITLFFNKTSVFINKIEFLRVKFLPPPLLFCYIIGFQQFTLITHFKTPNGFLA